MLRQTEVTGSGQDSTEFLKIWCFKMSHIQGQKANLINQGHREQTGGCQGGGGVGEGWIGSLD